jgi:hypothetical protein
MNSADSPDKKETCHAHPGCTHAHGHPVDLTRRGAVRTSFTALLGGFAALVVGSLGAKKAQANYGPCCKCECRGFEGSTYQCSNCGHRYEDHGCMK